MSSTKVIVHRGASEIGGNCVEIATRNARLILDVGMPLSELGSGQKADRQDLIQRGVLRPVPGLFESGPKIDAIFLSHAHGDHCGLLDKALPEIPVYLTSGASKMLTAGALFAGQQELLRTRQRILSAGKPQKVGDFVVTAYLVDHSSYGSAAFLLEVAGKRIVYSGDLRLHGRKAGMAKALLKAIRTAPLDLLIMEGTTLSREDHDGPTEEEVETRLVASLKKTRGLALAMFSPQNVDRLVSYYRAAIQAGRIIVLDPYSALILYLIKSECQVPDPFGNRHIKIFIAGSFLHSTAARRLKKLIPQMKMVEASRSEIVSNPSTYLMIFREWMYERIFDWQLPLHSRLFYSYWPGYLVAQPGLKQLRTQLEASGCLFELVHASGHLYPKDLRAFVNEANPAKLIPIHTLSADKMKANFPQTVVVEDGKETTI